MSQVKRQIEQNYARTEPEISYNDPKDSCVCCSCNELE